ncbi:MAG: cobalamin B12-binding domain-containing protein [Deltaproteobacteria bacterium]|nr:cobalamin B12-binding domain-containing protein [Deltaproteobacteria bacterium]
MTKELFLALADFDEDFVLETLKTRLEGGESPLSLLKELQKGMTLVGERYGKEYYLSDLMLSADLFNRSMGILMPFLSAEEGDFIGRILIGTPKGDIHDLGKNIFASLARGNGFEVLDLGVNVPVETFVEKIIEFKPDILGFSSLITPAFTPMKEVMDILSARNLRASLKVIVGGGVVTATVKEFIGADGFTTDAMDGLNQCKTFVGAG